MHVLTNTKTFGKINMRCFAQLGTICTILKETLACNFTKSNAPSWVLSTFLKLLNGTKQRNASHMYSQFLVEGGGELPSRMGVGVLS